MRDERKNSFGRIFITIEQDTKNEYIHANWMGHLTIENIKAGAESYLPMFEEGGYSCVLNDTRLVLNFWDHCLEWLDEWAPQAALAGMTHTALVTTPETPADAQAIELYSQSSTFEVKLFDNILDAGKWLRKRCVS